MDPRLLDNAFLQRVDVLRQPRDVFELVAGKLCHQAELFSQPCRDRFTVLGLDQWLEVRRTDGVKLMYAPLHPVRRSGALLDQDISALGEQAQVS